MRCFGLTDNLKRCKQSAWRWGLGLFCRRHTVQVILCITGVVGFLASILALYHFFCDSPRDSWDPTQELTISTVSTRSARGKPTLELKRKDLVVIAEWSNIPQSENHNFYLLQKSKYGRFYTPIAIRGESGQQEVTVGDNDIKQMVVAEFLIKLTPDRFPSTGISEDPKRFRIVACEDIPPREKDR